MNANSMVKQPTIASSNCALIPSGDIARYLFKALQTRTPLAASFELTRRCNFRCVHCYLGDQESIWKHRHKELDTKAVFRLLEEMAEAGTLFLTLTGGDPMLRPDFAEIYRQARRLGLLVTVFCNGSLISDEIVRVFEQYPPRVVEITLYGATAKTFAAVTQKEDSFFACMTGVERLRQAGVRLRLKSMVMTLNVHEFSQMRQMAAERGLQFRHDCSLHAALPNEDNNGRANGGGCLCDTLRFRLDPELAAAVDMSVERLAEHIAELAKAPIKPFTSNSLHRCGAGRLLYHVTPYRQVQPCLICAEANTNEAETEIMASWNGSMKAFIGRMASKDFPCPSCQNKTTCTACPSVFALAADSPEQVDLFYCQYARHRAILGEVLNA